MTVSQMGQKFKWGNTQALINKQTKQVIPLARVFIFKFECIRLTAYF